MSIKSIQTIKLKMLFFIVPIVKWCYHKILIIRNAVKCNCYQFEYLAYHFLMVFFAVVPLSNIKSHYCVCQSNQGSNCKFLT